MLLLIDKARTKHIKGISNGYKRLADEKRDVLKLKIISAVQLDEQQVEKIREKYSKTYKKGKVSAILQIDKSLIGGIKVQIGDRVEDYSIKSRLDSLRSLLIQD
ncbi:MAG: ATP synthase subunit delta [Firmicutes bacterium ADurb.Bin419]|nr:MAG: ATP synthase subunit delta [Firmicutes bacterium ADurb.Bin419]